MKRPNSSRLLDITVGLLATGAIVASIAIPLAHFLAPEMPICPHCRGTGALDYSSFAMDPCPCVNETNTQ